MITLAEITSVLGWTLLINLLLLLVSAFALTLWRQPILRLHSRMLAMEPAELQRLYLHFIAQFKVLVIVFNLAPYLALRLVMG